jgi:plasmid stabilization system protein ParE
VTSPDVYWTPEAESDLEEIAYYIAVKEYRPLVAEQIVLGIHETCFKYAASPSVGQSEPRLGVDCRRFTFKRWVIIYRPWNRGIAVLRIVDSARDFDRLLGGA